MFFKFTNLLNLNFRIEQLLRIYIYTYICIYCTIYCANGECPFSVLLITAATGCGSGGYTIWSLMKQTSAVQSDLKMIEEENVGMAITLQRKLADGEFPGGYSRMA